MVLLAKNKLKWKDYSMGQATSKVMISKNKGIRVRNYNKQNKDNKGNMQKYRDKNNKIKVKGICFNLIHELIN